MKKIYLLVISLGLLCSCSHNLKFPANHFAVPVTAETQWGGHVAVGASGTTTITVVDDITSNPPNRNKVYINERTDLEDSLYVTRIMLDGALSVLPSLELYADGGVYGLRWQFLNHDPDEHQWVAAVQAGAGGTRQSRSVTSSFGSGEASSDIQSKQAALSVGYTLPSGSVPYVSYLYQVNDVTTKVTNSFGSFPDYHDRGVHQSLALGITSYGRGLHFTIEYAFLDLAWDRAARTGQSSLGGNIGFAW